MGRQYKVIDSDGHVCEPPNLWLRYIEPRYRERAQRLVMCPDCEERLNIDGRMGGQRIRHADAIGARDGKPYPKTYLDGMKGGFDPTSGSRTSTSTASMRLSFIPRCACSRARSRIPVSAWRSATPTTADWPRSTVRFIRTG